jgi:hypothetical protein
MASKPIQTGESRSPEVPVVDHRDEEESFDTPATFDVMVEERAESEARSRRHPEAERRLIRMSLDLTPEMKAVIDHLARDYPSKADLLRHAVALLKVVKEGERRGEMPALINEEGQVTARIVGV